MITLMVNAYAEPAGPAIASARMWVPEIDQVVLLHGRYEGFPQLPGSPASSVFASEHAKRNEMLRLALPYASPERWLFWLDCDERVTYASPQLAGQLERAAGDVVGLRFVHPLPPGDYATLLPGLGAVGRRFRDNVTECFPGRLFRHLPGLEFRHRHDYLLDTDSGRALMGWAEEEVVRPEEDVDLQLVHLWWSQPPERRAAKEGFYAGPVREAESRLRVGRNI